MNTKNQKFVWNFKNTVKSNVWIPWILKLLKSKIDKLGKKIAVICFNLFQLYFCDFSLTIMKECKHVESRLKIF